METAMKKIATYTGSDGKKFIIEYDSEDPCRICQLPIGEASVGGTNICPYCDMGMHRDGRKWTYQEMRLLFSGIPYKDVVQGGSK